MQQNDSFVNGYPGGACGTVGGGTWRPVLVWVAAAVRVLLWVCYDVAVEVPLSARATHPLFGVFHRSTGFQWLLPFL